jgi:hypothetical protein
VRGEGAERVRELGRHLQACTRSGATAAGRGRRLRWAQMSRFEMLLTLLLLCARVVAGTRARGGSAAAVGCGSAAAAWAWPVRVLGRPHASRERARGRLMAEHSSVQVSEKYMGVDMRVHRRFCGSRC